MAESVELELHFVAQTAAAYGVTEEDPEDPVIWLPKSQVDKLCRNDVGSVARFEVPEWLAIDKGLV